MRKYRDTALRYLLAGCRRAIKAIRKRHKQDQVYGFILTVGYSGAFASVALRGVDDQPTSIDAQRCADLIQKYPHMREELEELRANGDAIVGAAEWQGWGEFSEEFSTFSKWLERKFDSFYDEGYTPEQIDRFLESLVVSAIKTLKSEGVFDAEPFEAKVLLGGQSHDPSDAERVIRISKKVNGRIWHSQIVGCFEPHLDESY